MRTLPRDDNDTRWPRGRLDIGPKPWEKDVSPEEKLAARKRLAELIAEVKRLAKERSVPEQTRFEQDEQAAADRRAKEE